ncbi:MAG: hypothetical protein AAB463_00940 [Patescibacteria group bacterium]
MSKEGLPTGVDTSVEKGPDSIVENDNQERFASLVANPVFAKLEIAAAESNPVVLGAAVRQLFKDMSLDDLRQAIEFSKSVVLTLRDLANTPEQIKRNRSAPVTRLDHAIHKLDNYERVRRSLSGMIEPPKNP